MTGIFKVCMCSSIQQWTHLTHIIGVFVPAGCVFHSYLSLCGHSDPADQRCNARGRQRRYRILHWFPVQSDKSVGRAGNCFRVKYWTKVKKKKKIAFKLIFCLLWRCGKMQLLRPSTLCLSVGVESWPFPPTTTSTTTCSKTHLWSRSLMLVGGAQMSGQHKAYFTFFNV